ncbi:MAG TPA: exodeoxyribonuclease VII small subunit [Magnetospirillaceae bacterium]|nr:exodeoxyribonuclease VII small subunit [Magnetospirillaceae bacterium]
MAELPADIAGLSFEEALAELERIVRQLEEGKGPLDAAIDAYSRGSLLKRHCEAKLAEAQARVDRIVLGSDGAPGLQPADFS